MNDVGQARWYYCCRGSAMGIFTTTFRAETGDPTLALIDPFHAPRTAGATLDRIILNLPPQTLAVDFLVLRDNPYDDEEPVTLVLQRIAPLITELTGKSPGIALLGNRSSGNFPRALSLTNVIGDPLVFPSLLQRLRALELHGHLVRTGAVYEAPEAHFLLPSGVHASTYIRVADILDSPVVISRLADWVEPFLTRATVVLADTWTILPLLQELQTRIPRQPSSSPAILAFSDYPTADSVRQTLDDVATLLVSHENPQLLFISSVVGSGQMLERTRSFASTYLPGVTVKAVALVNTGATDLSDSVFLDLPVERFNVPQRIACKLCTSPARAPVVVIDPKKYAPVTESFHHSVMLKADVAVRHRDFWQLADKQEAVSVHCDETTKGSSRHLSIDIRVDRLLKDDHFAGAVAHDLQRFLVQPDVVLIPSNLSTDALRSVAAGLYPNAEIIILGRPPFGAGTAGSSNDLVERSKDQLRQCRSDAKSFLVLDEVLLTGTTLRAAHRLFQEVMKARPDTDYRLSAFFVLGRPEHEEEWHHLVDSLRQQDKTIRLECHKLIEIPNGLCAWCEEDKILDQLFLRLLLASQTGRVSTGVVAPQVAILQKRLAILRSPTLGNHLGLTKNLFICNSVGKLESENAERITRHSLFGELLSETTAFAAVATAIHELRNAAQDSYGSRSGHSWSWPLSKIITAYHDPLLQASFMRSVQPRELLAIDRPRTEDALSHLLFQSPHAAYRQWSLLAAEHWLAAVQGKYPLDFVPQVTELALRVVKEWGGELASVIEVARDVAAGIGE